MFSQISRVIIFILMIGVPTFAQGTVDKDGVYRPAEEQIAKYKRLGELLRHPTFIRLRLISIGRDRPGTEPSTTPTPYAIDELMHFRLFITQDSSENLIIGKGALPNDYLLNLIRDGDIVSYRKDVQEKVDRLEAEPRTPRWLVSLEPGQEYPLDYVSLEDWYDTPLTAGHYQLAVRKQFAPGGDWVESNPVTFDVVVSKSALSISQPPNAQEADLDRLDQKLRRRLETKMPGWSYERIQPIQGSGGVLIQVWSIQNRAVRIVVVQKKSAAEAKESMQNFPRNVKEAKPWSEAGDEGYEWGFDLRQKHFRRGRTIIDIEVGADVDADTDAKDLTWSQRRSREKAEITRWTKEFSTHVVDSIDSP